MGRLEDKMVYKAAVCDDCITDAEYMISLLGKWAEKSGNVVKTESFPSAEAFLFHYGEERDFHMLLLDIEMGGRNGVDLAREVRRDNEAVQIVFITGFPDFMAEGYEVSALHYLMKPVSQEKLFAVLDRAAANLRRQEKRLMVVHDRQTDLVSLDQIFYLEAQRQYVDIHTRDGVYRMKTSLREMEASLDRRFFKCQRSFLVNLSHVVQIRTNCVVLKNGEEVPISRGMAEEVGRAVISLF